MSDLPFRIQKDANAYYHAQTAYISSSAIKRICKQSVLHQLEAAPPSGNALTVGSAFHTIVLEPDCFDAEFMVMNETINKRTKVGKARLAELHGIAATEGKEILEKQDFQMIQSMRDSFGLCDINRHMVADSNIERSFYVNDFHGCSVRIRPDGYCPSPNQTVPGAPTESYIMDLKSCQDASPRAFKTDMYKYGYHIQAAFYLDVLSHTCKLWAAHNKLPDFPVFKDFYFLAVEKKRPFAAQIYRLGDQMVAEGRFQYLQALKMWSDYLDTNVPSSFHHESQEGAIITL